jgi:hypothetical protein
MPTMTDQADIYRAAQSMVDRHGTAAPEQCESQSKLLQEGGDLNGAALWLLVARAAADLLDEQPGPGQSIH